MPVVITPQTGVCRHYQSYDLAYLWVRRQPRNEKYIFTGPDDFKRWSASQREEIWPKLKEWSLFRWKQDKVSSWDTFRVQTPEGQNKLLWITVNVIADKVHVVPPFLESDETLEIDLELCMKIVKEREWILIDVRAPQFPERMRRPAWQMTAIMETLVENDESYLTEEDLEILMVSEKMVRRMKTRQDPLRIFRYYRPVLEAAGVIK